MRSLYVKITTTVLTVFTSGAWAQANAPVAAQSEGAIEEQVKNLQNVAAEQWSTAKSIIDSIIEFCVKYSFQVLGGLIVLFLGWMAAGYAAKLIGKLLSKKQVDVTITKFITGIVRILILAFAIIVALGKFGIEIAPLIAGISVVGFGTSFALQGTLSNFVAGLSLIMTRPFKVGDIVEVAGVIGEVTEIKLPRTILKTVDGIMILVPNNHIVGEVIHNYSNYKRLNITIGISYKSDIEKAIEIIRDVVNDDKRIMNAEHAKIGVEQFADSSINICARLRVKQDEFFDAQFSINRTIFDKFAKAGVEIPFPQRDVHIFQAKAK